MGYLIIYLSILLNIFYVGSRVVQLLHDRLFEKAFWLLIVMLLIFVFGGGALFGHAMYTTITELRKC